MLIQLLVDNPDSWIIPYVKILKEKLSLRHNVKLIHNHKDVVKGDVLCLLSCERIFKRLDLNNYNLVVHESALPHGKGWSPLTWQITEGKNIIPITLFEAAESVDSGKIYFQDFMLFKGHELFSELKYIQGQKTIELIIKYFELFPNINGAPQKGESTFYRRRKSKDCELDVYKSISEQFNLLRVCDYNSYPAYFWKDGIKYKIKIEKA